MGQVGTIETEGEGDKACIYQIFNMYKNDIIDLFGPIVLTLHVLQLCLWLHTVNRMMRDRKHVHSNTYINIANFLGDLSFRLVKFLQHRKVSCIPMPHIW